MLGDCRAGVAHLLVMVGLMSGCATQKAGQKDEEPRLEQREADERFAAAVTRRARLISELERGERGYEETQKELKAIEGVIERYRPEVCPRAGGGAP